MDPGAFLKTMSVNSWFFYRKRCSANKLRNSDTYFVPEIILWFFMDHLHICEGSINAEWYIQALERHVLPFRQHAFQDNTKMVSMCSVCLPATQTCYSLAEFDDLFKKSIPEESPNSWVFICFKDYTSLPKHSQNSVKRRGDTTRFWKASCKTWQKSIG